MSSTHQEQKKGSTSSGTASPPDIFGAEPPRFSASSTAASVHHFVASAQNIGTAPDAEAINLFRRGRALIGEIDSFVESHKGVQHSPESLDEVGRLAVSVSQNLLTYAHEAARFEYFGIMKSAAKGIDVFTQRALAELRTKVGEEALRTGSPAVEDSLEDVADTVVATCMADGHRRLESQPIEHREWLLKEMQELWHAAGRFFVDEVKLLVLEGKDLSTKEMLLDGDAALERARVYAQKEQEDIVRDEALHAILMPVMKKIAERLDRGGIFLELNEQEKRLQAALTTA